jgi:hypothetical protein
VASLREGIRDARSRLSDKQELYSAYNVAQPFDIVTLSFVKFYHSRNLAKMPRHAERNGGFYQQCRAAFSGILIAILRSIGTLNSINGATIWP